MEGLFFEKPKEHLQWILNRFGAESALDRQLILLMLATLFWNGERESRPCFVISGGSGCLGRWALATLVECLSPGRVNVRVANGLISVDDLFVGDSCLLDILVIKDGCCSMSVDAAKRSVIIRVTGDYSDGWSETTLAYVESHRKEIVDELADFLSCVKAEISSYGRFAEWEKQVVCCLANPDSVRVFCQDFSSDLELASEVAEGDQVCLAKLQSDWIDSVAGVMDRQNGVELVLQVIEVCESISIDPAAFGSLDLKDLQVMVDSVNHLQDVVYRRIEQLQSV